MRIASSFCLRKRNFVGLVVIVCGAERALALTPCVIVGRLTIQSYYLFSPFSWSRFRRLATTNILTNNRVINPEQYLNSVSSIAAIQLLYQQDSLVNRIQPLNAALGYHGIIFQWYTQLLSAPFWQGGVCK